MANVEVDKSKTVEVETEEPKEEAIAEIAPSAPVFDECVQPATQTATAPAVVHSIQYPNLNEMHRLEEKAHNYMNKQRSILRPFTKKQLKELYQNPEIVLAETFEEEFISNELHFAYREHQLYELLKKFSQSRYNIKINSVDLQGFVKAFQTNSSNVWNIENRTKSFSNVCKDGVSVQKYVNYE